VNQLQQVNHVTLPFEFPFNYNFNFVQEIPENYVIGVLVLDAVNYLFTMLLIIGIIELSPKILNGGSVLAAIVSTASTILLLLISYVYQKEVNEVTSSYLTYNLVLHIIRSLVSSLLTAPIQRQVRKRARVLTQMFAPGSIDEVNTMPMQPTAPGHETYYR
jgi:hypothetical protein